MRNILITVMMLIVVALMFNSIVAKDTTGTRARIETQGNTANTTLGNLHP
ncbi:hypothetical protein [Cohnella abietis]|uniref:Uncharacterized protein n=1 Tax=Cohnella abietis TaxID=2507935 RepID=A0A3T1DBB1_9BACL|nr:hypothetical protein [Cohnella abietis]BBI35268.1 hypothetical protein KCTCHS21_46670 [Cohnella abietis]